MQIRRTDCLIIGSGIAGLMMAEILSQYREVTIITKSSWNDSNSFLAQGGIASVSTEDDHWTEHFLDTVKAGEYHNLEEMVRLLVTTAPEMVNKLKEIGVPFDRNKDGSFMLAQEGGHSRRRIFHAGGDATGKEIVSCLYERVRRHVTVIEYETAIELISKNGLCYGAFAVNKAGERTAYLANHTILSTGGLGQLYSFTSNHPNATGDGIALAYRAGAKLSDLEFIQFHPTLLIKDGKCLGLVSEAVRGEGACLVTDCGQFLMDGIHPMKDLAPRHIVANAIYNAINQGERVYLDISAIPSFEKRFPTISHICKVNGVSLSGGLLPVAPGSHFLMGGVVTDSVGRTNIKRLYAIGEVANTTVHGANRLASNSLLEAIVFAKRAAKSILNEGFLTTSIFEQAFNVSFCVLPKVEELRAVMDRHVGIVRHDEGLSYAVNWFETYLRKEEANQNFSLDDVTRRNMTIVGWLVTKSALLRTESRGGHNRSDYPNKSDKWCKKRIIHQHSSNRAKGMVNQ